MQELPHTLSYRIAITLVLFPDHYSYPSDVGSEEKTTYNIITVPRVLHISAFNELTSPTHSIEIMFPLVPVVRGKKTTESVVVQL